MLQCNRAPQSALSRPQTGCAQVLKRTSLPRHASGLTAAHHHAPQAQEASKTRANSKAPKCRLAQFPLGHHAIEKGAKQCDMPVVRALSPDPFFRRAKSTAAIKQANEAGRNKRYSQ